VIQDVFNMCKTCDDDMHMIPLSNPSLGNQRWVLPPWVAALSGIKSSFRLLFLGPPQQMLLPCVSCSFIWQPKRQPGTVLTQDEQSPDVSVRCCALTSLLFILPCHSARIILYCWGYHLQVMMTIHHTFAHLIGTKFSKNIISDWSLSTGHE